MNRLNVTTVVALVLTALAMSAAFAHLLELPAKIRLDGAEYLTVQQIYRGWALLGIVIYAALVSTFALTIWVRKDPLAFRLTLIALLCIVAAQIVFWVFTYPVNQETRNWTVLPEDWQQLRTRWEFSHAFGALFEFCAFAALVVSVVARKARTDN
jgi:hypothetical protein